MGTIKTTNIEPIADNGTVTLGSSGDTITIPSGVTITNNGTQTGFGGNNTPAFFVTRGSDQTISDLTQTKIQLDTEILDTDNNFDNSTNYRFTPTTAGKYFIFAGAFANSQANSNLNIFELIIKKNTTEVSQATNNLNSNPVREFAGTLSFIVDMNGSSDYIEMFATVDTADSGSILIKGHSSPRARTFMGGYKLIGV
jgi:hypothetical protein